jgi:hypothetical protein
MALTKNIVFKGIEVDAAYCKVANVSVTKNSMSFSVSIYSSKNEGEALDNVPFYYAYDIAGENPIKQAYEHLKTLPEFSRSVDV